jgi:glucokinase
MNILFDIGGSRMRVAASTDGLNFSEPLIVPTPKDFEEGFEKLTSAIRMVSHNVPIERIIGGLPGTLASNKSELMFAPNLPQWQHGSIRDRLTNEFGAEVTLENDSALVALGEAVHGAGQGYNIVAYLTFSTGVGGARITTGTIDRAAFSFEPGKMIIDAHGSFKTVEDGASGAGFIAQYGKEPKLVTEKTAWLEAARIAARGVHTAVMFWSPDVIVLGGPMIVGDPAIPLDEIEKEARFLLKEREGQLLLRRGTLESYGGLHGALALLNYRMANASE